MPRPEEPKPKISLEDLLKQHGSLADIPDDALTKLGYVRVEDGRIIKKRDIEKYKTAPNEAKTIEDAIARKVERQPFTETEFPVYRKKDDIGKRLNRDDEIYIEEQIQESFEKYEDVREKVKDASEYVTEPLKYWYGDGDPIVNLAVTLQEEVFTKEFVRPLLSDDYTEEDEDDLQNDLEWEQSNVLHDLFSCYLGPAEHAQGELKKTYTGIAYEVYEKYQEDPDGPFPVLTSQGSLELNNQLERLRGKFRDPDFYKERFLKELTEIEHGSDNDGVFVSRKLGYPSAFDLLKFAFPRVLEMNGLKEDAERLRAAQTIDEMLGGLSTQPPIDTEERVLREKIKAASVEEKKELSQALKTHKEQRTKQDQLLRGIRTYLETPKALGEFFSRKIAKAQNRMVYTSAAEAAAANTITLLLDARPNDRLDKDPGAMSGDCTEGKPLPFQDPNILVYNVKVYEKREKKSQHIGNIYLLETTTDAGDSVWHLEAVQIPSNYDWKDAAKQLIKDLAAAAQKKEVSHISINTSVPLVSNYDYIGKALLDYFGHDEDDELVRGSSAIRIRIPRVRDPRYSAFQSTGEAYVLSVTDILSKE